MAPRRAGRGWWAVLEVNLLGSVEAWRDGAPVELSSPKQRALLAALALAAGSVVSVDALTEALWDGDEAPADPKGALQSYVSRLRSRIGTSALLHEPAGYRLAPASVRRDLDDVDALVAVARAASDPAEVAAALGEAIGRWRGPALHELAGSSAFAPELARLAELRRALVDEHHEALLAAGQAIGALPGLEQAAVSEPLRERTQLLLVEGLARAGRNAEALRAADRFRRRLVEEAGLDPGPALGALEARILDGTLGPAAGEPPVLPDSVGPGPGAPDLPVRSGAAAAALPRSGRFVGREAELGGLEAWLGAERLVSVVGPGGVGKTRLVAELLAHLGATPVVMELAALRPGELAPAVAQALGIRADGGGLDEALAAHLALDPVLLVLDGCEHLLDEVRALVRRVLAGATSTRVLVTSRVRLGLPGEQVVPLDPLPVPEQDGPATAAVELFLDRARRADHRLVLPAGTDPTVVAICRHLDGVPLALELAAGRLPALGLEGLHDRLDQALDLLASPVPPGPGEPDVHTSLRATVAWSDRLLPPGAATALRALSVFDAGFTLRAAEAVVGVVCPDPGLAVAQLVDASLVLVDHSSGAPRYRLLDVVRRYAAEALDGSDHAAAVAEAHTRWHVELLAATAAAVPGPTEDAALAAARSQRANLRSGLRRVLDLDDPDLAATVSAAAARLVLYHSDLGLLVWLRDSVVLAPSVPDRAAATLLAGSARAAYLLGDLEAAQAGAEAALARPAGPVARAVARHALGVRALYAGRHDDAEHWWQQVVDDPDATPADRADALAGIALARTFAGRPGADDAAAGVERAARELGSATYAALHEYVAGEVAQGVDPATAATRFERAIELAGPSGAEFIAGLAATALTSVLGRTGQHRSALDRFDAMIGRWRRWSTWTQLWTVLRHLAEVLADHGEGATALALLDAADADPAAAAVTGADHERITALRGRLGPAPAGSVPLDRAGAVVQARAALDRLR